MDESLHNDERILRYLDGSMSAEERRAFEEEMQQNPALAAQTENLRLSIDAVKLYGIRQKVSSVHKEMIAEVSPARRKGKVVPFRKIVRYTMAAAASIILLFLIYQGFIFSQLSPEKLYNESFVAYEPGSRTRGEQTEVSTIQKAFEAREYQQVIDRSKDQEKGLIEKDRLLIALSYLQTEQLAPAIKRLEQLSKEGTTYRQDAEYYLALAYLKEKDYDKSLALMRSIRDNESHLYHQQFSNAYIRKVKLLKWK